VQMHPQTLAQRRWQAGQLLQVESRRGTLVLPAEASASVAPGQAFIAMHWGSEVLGGQGSLGVNGLTTSANCPQSRQPELKHAAVRISPAELPWGLVAAAWLPADRWLAVRERLRPLMSQLAYALCLPFGREPDAQVGLLWRSAHDQIAPPALRLALEQALGLQDAPTLRYDDAKGGQHRVMQLDAQGRLQAFMLAGQVAAQDWVLDLLQQGGSAATLGRALLAGGAQPPTAVAPRSPQVCACHDVSQAAIDAALATIPGTADQRLAQLQARLRCGTQCGSCLPAVKACVQRASAVSPDHTLA
jgi:assimilatory nitrate reductase catalytic subunit